jgi:hypothetical protein
VGKGWYNLCETNWHTYEFSKLRRLLLLVRLIMEDTLRMVGEDSMVKFNAFLKVRAAQEGGALTSHHPQSLLQAACAWTWHVSCVCCCRSAASSTALHLTRELRH